MNKYLDTCMHACMCACVHTCVRACMCACVRACMHVCVHVCIYIVSLDACPPPGGASQAGDTHINLTTLDESEARAAAGGEQLPCRTPLQTVTTLIIRYEEQLAVSNWITSNSRNPL